MEKFCDVILMMYFRWCNLHDAIKMSSYATFWSLLCQSQIFRL